MFQFSPSFSFHKRSIGRSSVGNLLATWGGMSFHTLRRLPLKILSFHLAVPEVKVLNWHASMMPCVAGGLWDDHGKIVGEPPIWYWYLGPSAHGGSVKWRSNNSCGQRCDSPGRFIAGLSYCQTKPAPENWKNLFRSVISNRIRYRIR